MGLFIFAIIIFIVLLVITILGMGFIPRVFCISTYTGQTDRGLAHKRNTTASPKTNPRKMRPGKWYMVNNRLTAERSPKPSQTESNEMGGMVAP